MQKESFLQCLVQISLIVNAFSVFASLTQMVFDCM